MILTPTTIDAIADKHAVPEGSTHYEGCEYDHPRCAIAALVASHRELWEEYERLRAERQRGREWLLEVADFGADTSASRLRAFAAELFPEQP